MPAYLTGNNPQVLDISKPPYHRELTHTLIRRWNVDIKPCPTFILFESTF
jgi:hypothetical protein